MTIVCCWFDRSFGRSRISAIADARAAYEHKGRWIPLAETTLKLFKSNVKCHALDDLDLSAGTWRQPYYETEIGIGFAGYCFEALSIIALLSRCLEQLVIAGAGRPKPSADHIVNFAREIVVRYFRSHSVPASQTVKFIIFGFSPEEKEPWVGTISHKSGDGVHTEIDHPMRDDRVYLIGDGNICHGLQSEADTIIKKIRRHAAGLAPGNDNDANFEHELELSRHENGQKKFLEELVLSNFPKHATVGGVLQKIELFRRGGAAVAAFTRDDRPHILQNLPVLDDAGLGYMSIGEVMGQEQRK